MHIAAILVAAGRGTRMGRDVPKAFIPLNGRPLFLYSVETLLSIPAISSLIVAVAAEQKAVARQLLSQLDTQRPIAVVDGGAERQDSVGVGVAAAAAAEIILVHDAARPFVSRDGIEATIASAVQHGAAILAQRCNDTVKQAAGADADVVAATLDRRCLWLAQTPQVARADWLRMALQRAARDEFVATDEAALLERYGYEVRLVPGDSDNRKLTTPADLEWAEWFVRRRVA